MGNKLTIMKNLLPFVAAPVTSYGKYINMLAMNSNHTHGDLKMQIHKEREHSLSGSQNHLSLPLPQSSLPLLRIIQKAVADYFDGHHNHGAWSKRIWHFPRYDQHSILLLGKILLLDVWHREIPRLTFFVEGHFGGIQIADCESLETRSESGFRQEAYLGLWINGCEWTALSSLIWIASLLAGVIQMLATPFQTARRSNLRHK